MKRSTLIQLIFVQILGVSLTSCTSYWKGLNAHALIKKEKVEGVSSLQTLADKDPTRFRYDYLKERDKITQRLLIKAQQFRQAGQLLKAAELYNSILYYDTKSSEATRGLLLIEQISNENKIIEQVKSDIEQKKIDSAVELLELLIQSNPENIEAKEIYKKLNINNPIKVINTKLDQAFKKPVSINLSDVDVRSILDLLAQASNLNFILDASVKPDLRTTIFAKNTSVEDALKLILNTNQLKMKILNDRTLLIYQDSEDKRKQYEELIVRNFYLKNIDPKKMQEMIKSLIMPKYMYIDDKLKLLAVRDNADVLSVVEKLIESYDVIDPEVLLDVEVLEISSDDMLNVGIRYPDEVKLGLVGGMSGLTLGQLKKLNSSNYPIFFPDPLAVLNLKQTSGKTKTLANPRIRVINKQKAKFLIGDKVPVITTTVNQTSSASTESISYLDVGIRLSVEPEIHVNDEVSISIDMEVSNIAKEIKSTTGLLAYQIGTRNVSTQLRLLNGETQVLAGLIKNDQSTSASHIPGLGKIPLLGKLFSDETKKSNNSEIVLLITPHIIRNILAPNNYNAQILTGTNNDVTSKPLRLTPMADYDTNKNRVLEFQIPSTYPNPISAEESSSQANLIPNLLQQSPGDQNTISPALLAPPISLPGNSP